MVEREQDIAEVEDEEGNIVLLPAIKILNERGEFSATQGAIMPWLRPYTKVYE
jgi:benzoate 4-monooxygenase